MNSEESFQEYPLRHELDVDIIMHKEVHFGGNFKIMLDYYISRGKGARPEFEFELIRNLAEFEQLSGKNVAVLLLSETDVEKVTRAKNAYKLLRDLYEQKNQRNKHPLLIADLILSEEEEPLKEIEAVVQEKSAIVPALLDLLKSEEFYDPLFPGYGQAPVLAAKCLGLIGDKRAIISLFESIGGEDFFNEDIVIQSLKYIGEPAKEFLLHVVRGRPINFDNERAAIALIQFKDDPLVSGTALELVVDPQVRKDFALSTYLALICEGLTDPVLRKKFLALANDPSLSKMLKRDIESIAKAWN